MLRYENSRFHLDNISFQIPEGFLLEDCSGEDSSLTLAPPDHSFTLELRVNHGCMDAETELSYLFTDVAGLEQDSPITPVTHNGLPGSEVSCTDGRLMYYELRLDFNGRYEQNAFVLVLSTENGLHSAQQHPGVQSLLHSLRLEPPT